MPNTRLAPAKNIVERRTLNASRACVSTKVDFLRQSNHTQSDATGAQSRLMPDVLGANKTEPVVTTRTPR
jgi:hypothetical protein